ncbi:hypothetical protein LIER_18912 [Lithospermum erythrorhizon]|uniref:Non-haem dioxygenase N-terminal domain-containing protein n=1 Tax=Lithospermum erythrorhizon TaxID=34254 RepID=A0AAV3QIW8_LITER
MEKLVCNWSDGRTLPEEYVFPQDKRPGNVVIPSCDNIPVIDFKNAQGGNQERAHIIKQILEASQDYGFFQVLYIY